MEKLIFYFLFSLLITSFHLHADEHISYLDTNKLSGNVRYVEVSSSDVRSYFDTIKEENTISKEKVLIDNMGNEFELLQFEKGKPITFYEYEYDQNNKFIKMRIHSAKGIEYFEYLYNEFDKISKIEIRDENGNLLSRSEYKYAKEKKSKVEWHFTYNINKEIDFTSKTLFNEKGKPAEITFYNNDGSISSFIRYTYDNKNEIYETYDADGELYLSVITTYNDDHLPIKEITKWTGAFSNIEGSEQKYEYEYDDRNNWIKKIEFEALRKFGETIYEPTSSITRTISYYGDASLIPQTIKPDILHSSISDAGDNKKQSNIYVYEKIDPFDDINTIIFILDAHEGKSPYGDNISFIIRAKPTITKIYINWQSYFLRSASKKCYYPAFSTLVN